MKSWNKLPELEVHTSTAVAAFDRRRVHLWLLDLDGVTTPGGLNCLTPEERERAERLKDPVLRGRTMRRFAVSRQVLANVIGVPPEKVGFVYGVCGKPKAFPTIGCSTHRGKVSFNLSHSENVLALAVGFDVELGVDVEVVGSARGTPSFYTQWTREEATSKLIGVGIANRRKEGNLSRFEVRQLRTKFAGKEVVLALAMAQPSRLPDPYQGIAPEDPPHA